MSTDYDAACMTCRRNVHLGVRFTSGWAFGHGTNDDAGRRAIGDWLLEHLEHGHDVRVFYCEAAELDGFTNESNARGIT